MYYMWFNINDVDWYDYFQTIDSQAGFVQSAPCYWMWRIASERRWFLRIALINQWLVGWPCGYDLSAIYKYDEDDGVLCFVAAVAFIDKRFTYSSRFEFCHLDTFVIVNNQIHLRWKPISPALANGQSPGLWWYGHQDCENQCCPGDREISRGNLI